MSLPNSGIFKAKMNFWSSLLKREVFFHGVFWLALYFSFFVVMIRFHSLGEALYRSLVLVSPLILPVYLHAYVFEKFFKRKRIYLYLLLAILLVLLFGYFNGQLIGYLLSGYTETYFTLIFIIALFTGLQYLKIGTKQEFQLQQEEARRIKAELELQKVEARQIKAELDLLKSQVNPHFLFNTLNNIYSLILDRDLQAGEAVLKLSGLMRYLLDSSQQKTVALERECDFIKNYLHLEEIRLGSHCRIQFNISGGLSGIQIAPMLLIPFVENSFKHGISAEAADNFIRIDLCADQRQLVFVVENNRALKKNKLQEKTEAMGTKNVKRRLDLLYPAPLHRLEVLETESIFKIRLEIEY